MTANGRETAALILPYAVWMVLMLALPATPVAYAVRTFVTLGVLVPCLFSLKRAMPTAEAGRGGRALLWGVLGGLLVWGLWIAPESCAWYRRWCILGEGGTSAIDQSGPVLRAIRLFGSACVIAVAEELFFRRWLLRYAGFAWMVALFALEHDRYLVGALAGVVYGFLALRQGLLAAIVAHVVTNFALGLFVLQTGAWQLW